MISGAAMAIDFFAGDYTLRRRGAQGYTDGRSTEAAPTDSTIRAAVFQPTPRDVMKLPDGDRARVEWVIWSRTPLIAGEDDDNRRADQVQIKGRWFQVFKLSDRPEGGFNKGFLELVSDRGRSL